MTADRVVIEWRGPRSLRRERTATFTSEMSQIIELLENGPAGWVVARLDFLTDSLVCPFFVWRLELPTLRKEWCPPTDHRWTRPHRKAGTVEEVLP